MIDNVISKENKTPQDNSFFTFIKCQSKLNPEIYEDLLNNKKSLLCYLQYTDKLILKYLNEIENKKNIFLINKIQKRNHQYIINLSTNARISIKYKSYKNDINKKITFIFITFIFNLFKHFLLYKGKDGSNKKINNILIIIINIIGKLYQDAIINDDYFEIILKLLLFFTISKSAEKEPNEKDEITNIIFFKSCINIIKITFNNLIKLQNELSQRQEEIINNIIIFIKDNILNVSKAQERISYINKVYLYKNDYKTLQLIDLNYIISKTKSNGLKNNFIELLTDIYNFSFKYENIMRPMVKQIEPLFKNINKKNIKQMNDELNLIDFSLSLLNSLINKENQIKLTNSCLLKNGFYFGSKTSGLKCEFNNIGNEFIILFGFRIQSYEMSEITLFEIVNNKDNTNILKLFLKTSYNYSKNYELFFENKRNESTTRISIQFNKNYIVTIHVKTGIMRSNVVNVNYVKDNSDLSTKDYILKSFNGLEIHLKTFINENFTINFGCEIDKNDPNKIINKFRGFIGDIIILNTGNIKESVNDQEFRKILLNLEGDYNKIISIFGESDDNIFMKNQNMNPKLIEFKKKIKVFDNNNSLYNSLKAIISSTYFKFIEYKDEDDDISNMNLSTKNNILDIENSQVSIKKKYVDFKNKMDLLEEEKKIKINTSCFNKYFHIFENNLTVDEFLKYDGIIFLSLHMEYYYQVLSHIITNRKDFQKNEIKDICEKVNRKIIKNLLFFNNNIINILDNVKMEVINKYFYQMATTLLIFLKISIINIETIETLLKIFYSFDSIKNNNDYELIKYNLFDFLLNPKLYQEKDDTQDIQMEKLNYLMKNIYNIIKTNSKVQTEFIKKIYKTEILNKLLSFIWLIDNNSNEINNINNINNNMIEKNKKDKLFDNTSYYYFYTLLEFLQSCGPKKEDEELNNIKSSSQKSLNLKSIYALSLKSSKNVNHFSLDQENEKDMLLINYFYDKALKYKDNNNYIFSKMLYILFRINVIDRFEINKIEDLKSIIIKELKSKNEKNKIPVYVSCLMILYSFYFRDDKIKDTQKNEEEKKIGENLHMFIRSISLDLDFFYGLISSLKQVKYLYNDINNVNKQNDITKENNNDNLNIIKDITIIENKNNSNKNIINEKDEVDEMNLKEYKEIFNLCLSPLSEINLKNLNNMQIEVIKSILEDIVSLLFKNKKRSVKKEKYSKIIDSFSFNESNEQNIEKEIFNIIKKNLDIIYKFPKTKIYYNIFSADTKICAELFYLKYINNKDIEEKDNGNYIENEIKLYYSNLLKNHGNPFIFKFFLFLTEKKNISSLDNIKISLIQFIVDSLFGYYKDIKQKEENNSFYLYNNLINLLIIFNEELNNTSNYNSLLFENEKFIKNFDKYISLLDKTCLLYSNYYIEFTKKEGKIISEIIYDIFTAIQKKFYKKEFMETFIKFNEEEEKVFSIFYIIDIFKGKKNDKSKIYEKLGKYILIMNNLKNIHKKYFNKENNITKFKLFLNKKVYQIEKANFSLYFLAKTFIIYLKKKDINEDFKHFLKETFLNLLIDDIIRLSTKESDFYVAETCQNFPLYSHTKDYFQNFIIVNQHINNKLSCLEKFFNYDMKIDLEEEYNILCCYSSRLLHDSKKITDKPQNSSRKKISKKSIKHDMKVNNSINNEIIKDLDKINETSTKSISSKILPIFQFRNTENLQSVKNLGEDLDSNKSYISKISDINDKEYFSSFENLTKETIINNPKNYYFKIIFAEIYKDLIFNDDTFKSIKSAYLSKYRNFSQIHKDSKQTNYPIKQKNFSNSLEPRIFMRRDFNFYNERILKISHKYIKLDVLNKKLENIIFYQHKFKLKENKENLEFLYCELVTTEYIYFGKMYFLKYCIYFESEKEDPRDNNKTIDIYIKYVISNRYKDNISMKEKSVLIFFIDIQEIIQRRTLLVNQSIEIFHKNGKSYFFNFFRTENVKKAYSYFNDININLWKNKLPKFIFNINNNKDDIKKLLLSYNKGKKSNYEYILYLNKYSTRTYNDLSQYPVFPWLVKEYSDIPEILTKIVDKEINQVNLDYFRDMKYPISMQNEDKREKAKENFNTKGEKFPHHLYMHYSTQAYIFYYLMRINPYGENLIKLQNYKLENSNRMFNCFREIKEEIYSGSDNREIIPDFFCYFDYFCNLNCNYFGLSNKNIIDDFDIENFHSSKYINTISSYVNSLCNHINLLNNSYVSKILSYWVDNIFGKKQLPEKEEDRIESYNIYDKFVYEQKINLENKIEKNYNLYKEKKKNEKQLIEKINQKKDFIMNLGMNPRQILTETVTYEGKDKTFEIIYKEKKTNDKYIYFNQLNKTNFVFLKDDKKGKNKKRVAAIYNKEKEIKIYDCSFMNLLQNKNKNKHNKNEENIPLYKVDYAFSYLIVKYEKSQIFVFLSCQYLPNYFKVQYNDKILKVFHEDFVTCIKGRNLEKGDDNIFYTGLLNGKLTEWNIEPCLESNNKSKSKNKNLFNIKINEIKHVYAHKSSITAIEIYLRQNIIITSGEDKFIYIRKIFDFELLTVINLTYSYGNPIISKTPNIFPSLLKVSKLNLLYVLLYDKDNKRTIIRGYNLNGLFFAQTDPHYFKDNKQDLQFNNISFTKKYNLIVGFYNRNKFCVINASNLTPSWVKEIENNEKGTKMINYNYIKGEFYILYKNKFIIMTIKKKNELKEFDSF